MIILCNPFCHEVEPNPLVHTLHALLLDRYGSDAVLLDSAAVPIEAFFADNVVVLLVCDGAEGPAHLSSPLARFKASLIEPSGLLGRQARVYVLANGLPQDVVPPVYAPFCCTETVHSAAALGERLAPLLDAFSGRCEAMSVRRALERYLQQRGLRVEPQDADRISVVQREVARLSPSPSVELQLRSAPNNEPLFCAQDGAYTRRRYLCDSSDDWHHRVFCNQPTEQLTPCAAGDWWLALDAALDQLVHQAQL